MPIDKKQMLLYNGRKNPKVTYLKALIVWSLQVRSFL